MPRVKVSRLWRVQFGYVEISSVKAVELSWVDLRLVVSWRLGYVEFG